MSKISKRTSKTLNIFTVVLELFCKIVLLPFEIIKTVCYVAEELHR